MVCVGGVSGFKRRVENEWSPLVVMLGTYQRYFLKMHGRSWNGSLESIFHRVGISEIGRSASRLYMLELKNNRCKGVLEVDCAEAFLAGYVI